MANISDLIRSSVRRDVSVEPITLTPARAQTVSRQLGQPTPRAQARTQPKISIRSAISPYVTQLAQSSVRRDPSVERIISTPAGAQTVSRQLGQPTPRAQLPTSRGGATSSFISQLAQSPFEKFPEPGLVTSQGMGGAARSLPTGRNIVSPIAGDRTGVLPSSTLATQGVFGGETGGMGAAEGAAPTALGPETLTGIGSSLSKIGTGIMNTITSVAPLAIKVILAVIVIKIVLWLLRGRR